MKQPSPLLLHRALQLQASDTVAIIGAGGKTTALWRLARERRMAGQSVLVTTSTHIFVPAADQCDRFDAPQNAAALLAQCAPGKILCAGYPAENGKCTGLSPALFAAALASGLRPLYEADGAKRLPAKLHGKHEPVIHAGTDQVLLLAGLSALGQPVSQVCHRFACSARMAAQPDRPFDCEDLLETLRDGVAACGLPKARIRILLNQADMPALAGRGAEIAEALAAEGLFALTGCLHSADFL